MITREKMMNQCVHLADNRHVVCGVLDGWRKDYDLISCSVGEDRTREEMVRCPALDRRGQSRIHQLWQMQVGTKTPSLAWQAKKANFTAQSSDATMIIHAQVCPGYVDDATWAALTSE